MVKGPKKAQASLPVLGAPSPPCGELSANRYRELCERTLRAAGARMTKPRRLVIEALSAVRDPISAAALYEQLSGERLDRVTVYRILDTLYDLDLVHRVTFSGEFLPCAHLECSGVHHVIAHCVRCDGVNEFEVPDGAVSDLFSHLDSALGFLPETHVVHIDGTCAACRGSEKSYE